MSDESQEQYWEAMDLLDEGDAEAALEIAETLLEDAPDDIDFLELRGLALGQLGDHEEALEAFQRIIEVDPTDVDGHSRVSEALMELGRLEEAEAQIATVLGLSPEHAPAYAARGYLHDVAGRTADADADYAKSVAIDEELGPVPPRISKEAFAQALADCQADIGDELIDGLRRLTIEVLDFPPLEMVRDPGQAVTLSSPAYTVANGDDDGTGRMWLFKRNIERLVYDEGELAEQLEAILIEELELFLGLGEDDDD